MLYLEVVLFISCRRKLAVQTSVKKAIEVPLAVMREARQCWPHMETLAKHANVTVLSDLQVCAHVVVCVHVLCVVCVHVLCVVCVHVLCVVCVHMCLAVL